MQAHPAMINNIFLFFILPPYTLLNLILPYSTNMYMRGASQPCQCLDDELSAMRSGKKCWSLYGKAKSCQSVCQMHSQVNSYRPANSHAKNTSLVAMAASIIKR